jgi:CheY-like chemotaxis protein
MRPNDIHVMLADDDLDDCMFFEEVLKELSFDFSLHTVNDGEQLMIVLVSHPDPLPDVLFLDLNMPRKTGYECLAEIRENPRLRNLPVIILSTSLNHDITERLYEMGAYRYIRKPGNFSKLKKVIAEALAITVVNETPDRTKEKFIID